MKILYLSHRIPYPPNKGDKIRSFNEIKYLSKNHEIHLACLADETTDLKYENTLKTYCAKTAVVKMNKTFSKIKSLTALTNGTPMTVKYFYSKTLQSTINQWILSENYNAIICFSSPMAEYVFRSKPFWTEKAQGTRRKAQGQQEAETNPTSHHPNSKLKIHNSELHRRPTFKIKNSKLKITKPPAPSLIIDFCDLDSDKWAQYADRSSFPQNLIYRRESRQLLAYEKKVNQTFDHTIFVSQSEANLFSNLYPTAKNITVIPNGVDTTYFDPNLKFKIEHSKLKIAKSEILLFSGAMDYHANIDAVTWFTSQIFPLIKEVFPNAQFYIVGSNPNPDVKALANDKDIHVTGYVKDIRPYYQATDLCVVPIRLARGIQNKVLEAMAMEKPIVSTSQAGQGIDAKNRKHLLIEDTPHGFSKAVINLLKDNSLKKTLKTNARAFVENNYNWADHMNRFETLLNCNSAKK